MFRGLFSQIVIVIVAIAIVVTYVQPTFAVIGATQDDIAVYQEEQRKVAAVNAELATLLSQIEQIPAVDKQALLTYLPDVADIDSINIPRTLENITTAAGARFEQAYITDAPSLEFELENESLRPYTIEFSFFGTYDQVKRVFQAIEQNNYPLEVHVLKIAPVEDSVFLRTDVTLVTYAYESFVAPEEEVIR